MDISHETVESIVHSHRPDGGPISIDPIPTGKFNTSFFIAAGDEEFTVELEGRAYTQKPQKYHARSLAALRAKYAALEDRAAVDAALEKSGCLPVLRG